MIEKRKGSKFPRVVITHPVMQDADDGAWKEFGRLLVLGLEKWLKHLGGDPARVGELQREQLIAGIAEKLSPDVVAKLEQAESPSDRAALIHEVLKQVRSVIASTAGQPHAQGRKRTHRNRDAEIHAMRKEGLSYGRIAQKKGIERLAVQAASRREIQRRAKLYELYKQLSGLLRPLGVILKEKKGRNS